MGRPILMKHFETKNYITCTFLLCPTRLLSDLYSNLSTLKETDSFTDKTNFLQIIPQSGIKRNTVLIHSHCKKKTFWNSDRKIDRFQSPSLLHLLIVDDARGTRCTRYQSVFERKEAHTSHHSSVGTVLGQCSSCDLSEHHKVLCLQDGRHN